MKISIALCTYNGERFLQEQLRSIAAQTSPVDEIVLFDDCSNDSTLIIAKAMQQEGLPIHIYRNEQRLGFIANFEQAINTCTGDIVFLCDQDDIWQKNKVATMLNHFQANTNTLLLFSDGELINTDGEPLHCQIWQALPCQPAPNPSFIDLLNNDWITGATCAFRRELITLALPLPQQWVHDAWLGIIASASGGVQAIPEKLIAYRQHTNNQIGLKPPTLKQRIKKMLQLVTTTHKETPDKYHALLNRFSNQNPHYPDIAGKIRHLENRQKPNRLNGILKEITNKGYFQYANGWKSFFRDIILLGYQTMRGILPPSVLK